MITANQMKKTPLLNDPKPHPTLIGRASTRTVDRNEIDMAEKQNKIQKQATGNRQRPLDQV